MRKRKSVGQPARNRFFVPPVSPFIPLFSPYALFPSLLPLPLTSLTSFHLLSLIWCSEQMSVQMFEHLYLFSA